MDVEMRFHIEAYAEDLIRAGIPRKEALRRARIEFGGVERVKEECRDARGVNLVESLLQDLRYSLRILRKNPGFTTVAVLTLALCIGATTAIFSAVKAVLLEQLRYRDPGRIVVVWGRDVENGWPKAQVSFPDFLDLRTQNRAFERTAAIRPQAWTLTGRGDPLRVRTLLVTPGFFDVLGVHPDLGRPFLSQEGQDSKNRVIILSYRLWQARFGGDRRIIGRTAVLNGTSYTIVGVLPADLHFVLPVTRSFRIENCDVWAPLTPGHRLAQSRAVFTFEVVARLRHGVGLAAAQDELDTIGRRLQGEFPETNQHRSFYLVPLRQEIVARARPALLVLLAAVGVLLLIGCANLANLLLSRAVMREREMAVRAALGASRTRIIRQVLTEGTLVAILGGGAGIMLAFWLSRVLSQLPGATLPRSGEITLDLPVLLFSLALSVVTGVAFSLAPALAGAGGRVQHVLKATERGALSPAHSRLRNGLVVTEVALACMLLVGGGLLADSFLAVLQVHSGFRTENLLTFSTSLPPDRYPDEQHVVRFYRALDDKLNALHDVAVTSAISSLPLSGHNTGSSLHIKGWTPPNGQNPTVGWQLCMPGCFQALGIPLLRGRDFAPRDWKRTNHVTIINEALARRFFPNQNPIGRRVSYGPAGSTPDWHEIIGVVGDVRHLSLDTPPMPRAYDLYGQHSSRSMFILVRGTGDPRGLIHAARAQVRNLDAELPVYEMRMMDDWVKQSVAPRRFLLLLVGSFAGLALVLAAVGIYGVMSYAVAQRAHEIGIRVALGAQRRQIFRLVIGQGMALALAGLVLGVVGAAAFTRLLGQLLFGVQPSDPATFSAVTLLLALISAAACYLPALRAMRVDPMTVLRHE